MRGIRTLEDLRKNLPNIGTWLQKDNRFEKTILDELKCYEEIVKLSVHS
jgi:hypothetical protein